MDGQATLGNPEDGIKTSERLIAEDRIKDAGTNMNAEQKEVTCPLRLIDAFCNQVNLSPEVNGNNRNPLTRSLCLFGIGVKSPVKV